MIDAAVTLLVFIAISTFALMALQPFITDHNDPPHRH